MKTVKHVGRTTRGDKIAVVFRTLPGESNHALVVTTTNLPDAYHDSLMTVIESDPAQESFELGEILFIRNFPDGRPMLPALQADGRLYKLSTDQIMMTPSPGTEIVLSQLNVLIAEQKNCAVDELCNFVIGAPKKDKATVEDVATVADLGKDVGEPSIPQSQPIKAKDTEALSDKDIAKGLRSQADALYKEAARLRKQAEDLDPTVKKSVKTKEEVSV